MKKKIALIGPIGDYGGREVEANIILHSLYKDYDIKLVSTSYITDQSFALAGLNNKIKYVCILKSIYKSSIIFKLSSWLSKLINGGSKKAYFYSNNKLNKRLIGNYNEFRFQLIKKELRSVDASILLNQLSTPFLPELILFCNDNNIKSVVRTTGTIWKVNRNLIEKLSKADLYLHHSTSNAENLLNYFSHNYKIIDQCTLAEKELCSLKFRRNNEIVYGYLGRLDEIKGIAELVEFFLGSNRKLLVGGDGPLRVNLKNITTDSQNISFCGLIENRNIATFFDKIDVLIISSREETGPLVGIEAMAAGKIIFSTEVGAMKDRLEATMNRFWFDLNDLSTLEVLINNIEGMEIRERIMVQESVRKKFLNYYSFESISLKYKNVISEIDQPSIINMNA